MILRNDVIAARKISATLERSWKWERLKRMAGGTPDGGEMWENSRYLVTVRRHTAGWPSDNGPFVQIGVSSHDGQARHDWRDFQRIKNDVCGEDWEAIELYPSERRLMDPSNYYMLWARPSLPYGKFVPRTIMSPETCIAPQRGWRAGDEPKELKR